MERLYQDLISTHFSECEQMLFLAGPRQVGKSTVSKTASTLTDRFTYLNWDVEEHRQQLLKGTVALGTYLQLDQVHAQKPLVVFDEIHKYKMWKNYLKGFYDLYKEKINIIVTGSSRLDVFQKGKDSLMGRYFVYHMHPLSIAECLRPKISALEIQKPLACNSEIYHTLFEYGGFPEPFLKNNPVFYNRWKNTRKNQLFREDIRDLSHIQEISQLEILAEHLAAQAGEQLNLSLLGTKLNAAITTIKRWVQTLETFYYCFRIYPYSKNILRSLTQTPKTYLYDWSLIDDPSARFENFVASHLWKAIQFWTDRGRGQYELYYIRDKEKREVDFLIVKNNEPWFLVEAKSSERQGLSASLYRFHKTLKTKHAFQLAFDAKPVTKDFFEYREPIIVPAISFLTQLV